ncbi:hypothetical protein WMY93_011840 [Mugilogobius chulae]|uniref:Gypsy retrotransposon integrase-like protein 1 n=1 Tax=Mugilogobius chulae TaxID=88201 RepID=A0AAW0PDT4_9GOBI
MEDELQELRDQIAQLKADNERLRSNHAPASPTPSAGTSATPAASVPRTERLVYIPRDRRCPTFRGRSGIGIGEWIEEAQACIRERHLSLTDQAFFLYDHLEGEAREEIKFRSREEREDPTKILAILKELYGSAESYVALQEAFFSRKQTEGETLQEFSLALMGLMDKVKQQAPAPMPNADNLLRDQFIEHVLNGSLRRELKQYVRRSPRATLLEVRGEAIRWELESLPAGVRGRSNSVPSAFGLQYAMYGGSQREAAVTKAEQHLERLGVVLGRLQKEGLKAKLSKCRFFQREVHYLGHVISEEGVATDPGKIDVVANWPIPSTALELRSFLGFASYYRRFVEGFAKLAAPLHRRVAELSGKRSGKRPIQSVAGSWTTECQQSFDALKAKLTMAPVLAYADFSLPFILEVDASHAGLGAVLSQEQEGKVRPVAYASRGLRPTERNMSNYSSMKLELLALKWAMTEKFREYLLGHKCVVYTDNNPLSHLSSAKLGAVEQRWASQLASFDFVLRYRPGRCNGNADALSRQPGPSTQEMAPAALGMHLPEQLQQVLEGVGTRATQSAITVFPNFAPADLYELQQSDPVLQEVLTFWQQKRQPTREERRVISHPAQLVLTQWDRLVEMERLLYRQVFRPDGGGVTYQLLLPRALVREVLTKAHQEHGHQGIERTLALLRSRCYWPEMSEKWLNGARLVSVVKPRLPLDFLLGRVQDPVAGSVHEWVQEHQARLQVAFDGTHKQPQQFRSHHQWGRPIHWLLGRQNLYWVLRLLNRSSLLMLGRHPYADLLGRQLVNIKIPSPPQASRMAAPQGSTLLRVILNGTVACSPRPLLIGAAGSGSSGAECPSGGDGGGPSGGGKL